MEDVTSVYRVPLILEDQKVTEYLAERLDIPLPKPQPRKFLMKWRDLADRWVVVTFNEIERSCFSFMYWNGRLHRRIQIFKRYLISSSHFSFDIKPEYFFSEFWITSMVLLRSDRLLREVTICLVGKYTKLEDSYASVVKALNHAAMACNHKLDLKVMT